MSKLTPTALAGRKEVPSLVRKATSELSLLMVEAMWYCDLLSFCWMVLYNYNIAVNYILFVIGQGAAPNPAERQSWPCYWHLCPLSFQTLRWSFEPCSPTLVAPAWGSSIWSFEQLSWRDRVSRDESASKIGVFHHETLVPSWECWGAVANRDILDPRLRYNLYTLPLLTLFPGCTLIRGDENSD